MPRWSTKEDLNVRSGPGLGYEILDVLNQDDQVDEIPVEGWAAIPMEDGTVGWVSRQFLDPVVIVPAPAPTLTALGTSLQTPMAQAVNYFVTQGWKDFQAAAIVGNLMQESNLKATAVNSSSGATGIAQWLGGRLDDLMTFAGANGYQTFQIQLAFVNKELNGSEKAAGDALRATATLSDATMVVRTKYERCGESEANDANRLAQSTLALSLVAAAAPAPAAPVTPSGEPVWIRWARSKLGEKEGVNDPEIQSWYKLCGLPQSMWNDVTVPWCGIFLSAAFALNGVKAIDSALAVDWLNFGTPVTTPQDGDVVVFDWSKVGSSGHHVAFYLADAGDRISVIGGNQANSVSITTYAKAAVMGYRRVTA